VFRVDSHVYGGYTVPPYYDSMISKVIAYGNTRDEALARMKSALTEIVVDGIKTNTDLHKKIMADPGFASGSFTIHYLEKHLVN